MFSLRRLRGTLLRLVRRRASAFVFGVLLIAPAAVTQFTEVDVAPWLEGLFWVLAATGAAVAWTGLTGERPDWVE